MAENHFNPPHRGLYKLFPVEYKTWGNMIQRCKPHPRNIYHGNRGITVCERWRLSFRNFLIDMGPKPTPSKLYSLDRINNDGNYEPGNCRWATWPVQIKNQRPPSKPKASKGRPGKPNPNARKLTFNGKTQSVDAWAKEIGNISPQTIAARVQRGWTVEEALFKPKAKNSKSELSSKYARRVVTINGETKTAKEWSRIAGVPYARFMERLINGWQGDRLLTPVLTREEAGLIGARKRWDKT